TRDYVAISDWPLGWLGADVDSSKPHRTVANGCLGVGGNSCCGASVSLFIEWFVARTSICACRSRNACSILSRLASHLYPDSTTYPSHQTQQLRNVGIDASCFGHWASQWLYR